MPRYIDAEKLVKIINPYGLNNPLMRLQDIMRAIAITPTADVAPVVHAHWIRKPYFPDGTPAWVCSRCGRCEEEREPFCNCGARMDEEVKENE